MPETRGFCAAALHLPYLGLRHMLVKMCSVVLAHHQLLIRRLCGGCPAASAASAGCVAPSHTQLLLFLFLKRSLSW